MQELTAEGRRGLEEIAGRHGFSTGAAEAMFRALVAGRGTQAQFNDPELGGMGQWSQGGMLMIGDMFNNGLKAKVDGLANDLSALLGSGTALAPVKPARGDGGAGQGQSGGSGDWWPSGLGAPSSVGSQNSLRYAVFPASRRLVIDDAGKLTVHDTGDHMIGGVSQAQSGGQTLSFTSQHGRIDLADLPVVGAKAEPPAPAAAEKPAQTPPAAPATAPAPASAEDDIVGKLERLAGLVDKGILTKEEFAAKKTELLARL